MLALLQQGHLHEFLRRSLLLEDFHSAGDDDVDIPVGLAALENIAVFFIVTTSDT